MKRRILGPGLALLAASVVLPGCELLNHQARSKDEASLRDVADSEGASGGEVKSEPSKGFFKSSRLSGAMSDEGREIERDLGIK